MRIGSLCTGYGGLDMAVQSVIGGRLAWVADILPASCTVLAAHHPDVPNLGDFTTTDWSTVEPVDLLTAGYPCQPFSTAGKRKGTDDERHLWPFVLTAIRALRPRLVVLENVRGHLSLGFDAVLADLAAVGMSARWGVVRASDAGAPHGRARLFIVAWPADSNGARLEGGRHATRGWPLSGTHGGDEPAPDAGSDGHGQLVHAGGVGSVAGGSTGEARQRERTRGLPVTGSPGDAPDAEGRRRGTRAGRGTGAARREESGVGDGGRAAADADDSSHDGQRPCTEPWAGSTVAWGKYGPAIRRWEQVLGRPAPVPALSRATGRDRLNPQFVEWMMGLPAGHVTGHGLSASAELTLLGNGVVPQQAALALRHLLPARALAPTP